MAKALVLTAITGTQLGRKHALFNRVSTVGSASGNDLVLHDRQLDGRHAEIRQMLDRWFIVPVSPSGGGISVNGAIVRGQARLNPGDKLTLGAVTYEVSYEEEAEREVGSETPQPVRAGAVPRLGDYFVRRGIMTQEQVNATLRRQSEMQRTGVTGHFGQVAYELGYISRGQLDHALSDQRADFNDAWRD